MAFSLDLCFSVFLKYFIYIFLYYLHLSTPSCLSGECRHVGGDGQRETTWVSLTTHTRVQCPCVAGRVARRQLREWQQFKHFAQDCKSIISPTNCFLVACAARWGKIDFRWTIWAAPRMVLLEASIAKPHDSRQQQKCAICVARQVAGTFNARRLASVCVWNSWLCTLEQA